ncbi:MULTISPECIES: pirin family protein [Metallosphaera]|uniref:pirin family protein n=1 Tax=Metallosphaera TaxID=41980 RepID=UPI001F05677B|nr:pirin family protein [Metallosphaera sedula]MCH1772149.1 pirin family protein [Metallosphaera sedula]MCP6727694.1 pirin family protein [Metallosphaera sedula]
MIRKVSYMLEGKETRDGAGVKLYRVFGGPHTYSLTDPFLLLDFFGSDRVEDYIAGFPWHPHRGIETLTYLIQGKVEHEDSTGGKGVLYPGDAQWMTAGSGIFHQEMPKPLGEEDVLHATVLNTMNKGLQLWINLPRNMKMTDPVYRDARRGDIPEVKIDGGRVKIITGEYDGVEGPVRVTSPVDPTYYEVKLEPEKEFKAKVKRGYTVLAFVVEGSAKMDDSVTLSEGHLAIYDDGDEVQISTRKGAHVIVLSGRPINEPIAWYGPIVMNTEEELTQALLDLRRGTFVKKTPITQ